MLHAALPPQHPAPPAVPLLSGPDPEDAEALRRVVRAVVARVLGEPPGHPDVEDCTHEALRRALEGRERVHPGQPLRPWALGIARHVALDERRARRRARVRQPPVEPEQRSPVDALVDPAPAPDEAVDDVRRRRDLAVAMEKLPAGPREALRLMHAEGLGYQEIAERMRVPLGTVATWVSRGRRALMKSLELADANGARGRSET